VTRLPLHQTHDPRLLLARWQKLARRVGLRSKVLTLIEDEKVLLLESTGAGSLIYLSAGVHGDEVASAWGLLAWAEGNSELLKQRRFMIFPCLNPHGFKRNTRTDHRGLDINRRFHLARDPLIGPWRQIIRQRTPVLGLCLHEDYDSQGCYVYELGCQNTLLASRCLAASARHLPTDPRGQIDGRRANHGIIRRKTIPQNLTGIPEAVALWQLGCATTLTFETPSEADFHDRVQAHAAFIAEALS
jgi:protein MpaA